jgi:hypothetical protein
MSTKNYWFTEHGEWGSVEVEYVSFNSNHHDGIEQSFDLVSDWQLPDWARYLASRPHALEESGFGCDACEMFANEFRAARR